MPPKKKAVKAAKAPVKKAVKAPAKRPVGRPRKPLGTRVSDVDLLANVGSTKPMPRRVGRDALEQQRARLRYAVDYPGRRFTEQMTRALQDSFSTGALPYGVSLRAPANFARPYTTSFEPIAGMPVWPAINVPPNADAEDALRLVDAAQAAAAAVPDPSYRPTKRAKRSGAPILASLSGLNPGTSYVRDPNDTSEVYVPDTSIADRQAANRENMNKLAFQWMDQRQRELAEVRSASFARRRREGQLPKSQAIQDMNEELRRQNAAVSFPAPGAERAMLGIRNPPTLRSDQERALLGLDPRRRPKSTSTEPPPGDEELTSNRRASRPLVSPAAGRVGSLIEPSTSVLRLRRKNPLTPEMQAIADQLAPQLLRQEAPTGPVPTSQVLRLRQADTTPVLRLKGPAPPPNVLRLQGPAFDTRDIRAADAAIARDERRRKSAIKERAKNLGELLSQRPSPPTPPAQQMVVSVPDPVAVNTELQGLKLVALQLNDKLALQRSGKSQASTLMELRNVLGAIKEKEREVAAATPSSEPAAPVRTRVVMSDDTRNEIEHLQGRIAMANSVLSRPMSSAQAAEYGELRDDLSSDIRRVQELIRASTIPEPATAPQSIVVPGTETQVPLSAVQGLMAAQSRILDSLDHQTRVANAPSAATLDLRYDPFTKQYYSRDSPYETPRGRQALEVRPSQQGSDIDREQAELRVPRSRMETLVQEIASKLTPDLIKEEKIRFARMAEESELGNKLIEQSRNARLKKTKGPPVDNLRRAAKHSFMPPATARRLNEEADIRVGKAHAVVQETAEPAPGMATGLSDLELPSSVLQRIAQSPDSLPGTIALINEELVRRGEDERSVRDVLVRPPPGPADTVVIPPPSNPPEPPSQDGPATGAGLQHVTAATFPSSKWTTASSLRWLRSNGLHPIRKSTKINGAYSYALQSPAGYSSFNSVKMSHKNKDFTIVYGTPK